MVISSVYNIYYVQYQLLIKNGRVTRQSNHGQIANIGASLMKAILIIPSLPKRSPQTYTSAGACRYRIRFLMATFGACLNDWPKYAQDEHEQLSRRLRELEATK